MNNVENKHILPNDWIWATLEEILLKITDGSHNPPEKKEQGIPMLSAQNITNNRISFENIRYISHEDFAYEYERANIEDGDVLLTIVGSIGRTAFVPETIRQKFAIQRSVALLKPSNFLSGKYLMYAIQAPFFQKELESSAKGTAQKGVYLGTLKSFHIPLSPINEQYRIVEKIEELFSEVDHVEANLYDIKKRLDVYWKGILNTVYDKDYHNIELGKISNITMGQSPPGTTYNGKGIGIPLINGPVEFGKTSFSKTVLSKWTTKPTKTCKEGDIIICVRGSTTGRLNIAGFDACIGRGVAAIEAKQNVLNKYLLYFLHHKEKFILEMGTGTTFPSISKEQLCDLTIPLYTIEEQIDIVDNFDCKYSVIENSKNAIDANIIQIQILKQSVLNKAFEGKLVSQNPNDETAFELFKKIKAEQMEIQNKPKEKKVKIKIEKMERTKSVLDLLKEAQKPVSAKDIWQQSKHWESIDDFYAELKSISNSIEQTKAKTEILLSLKK